MIKFTDDGNTMSVYVMGHDSSIWFTARNSRAYVDSSIDKKDAPAFALAVLEAAGYTADNSCAGDAVRSLKFQIANDARAAEEAELDKEALDLFNTFRTERKLSTYVSIESINGTDEAWRAVARKARELHKETNKTEEAKA